MTANIEMAAGENETIIANILAPISFEHRIQKQSFGFNYCCPLNLLFSVITLLRFLQFLYKTKKKEPKYLEKTGMKQSVYSRSPNISVTKLKACNLYLWIEILFLNLTNQ